MVRAFSTRSVIDQLLKSDDPAIREAFERASREAFNADGARSTAEKFLKASFPSFEKLTVRFAFATHLQKIARTLKANPSPALFQDLERFRKVSLRALYSRKATGIPVGLSPEGQEMERFLEGQFPGLVPSTEPTDSETGEDAEKEE